GPDDDAPATGDGDGDPGDPGDGDPGDGDPGDGDPGDPGDDDPGDDGDGDGEADPDDDPLPPPDLGDQDPGPCAPFQGFETECAECLSDECCEAAAACSEAPDCECLAACDLGGGSIGYCKAHCGTAPGEVPELAVLLECAAFSCGNKC
ncbi:MAG TPA: hypothetical protein VK034_01770, partial [Enhygromyxa sp.]|nr:hypothetical protein [Enhygromyxa sp.]